MKKILIVVISFTFLLFAGADRASIPIPIQAQLTKPDYRVYDMVLATYVSEDGKVDYKGLRADKNFEASWQTMSIVHPGNNWTRNEQIAFWLNLYNMAVLKAICDHPEARSIKDIPNVMEEKFIKIGKQVYSLNQINREILQKRYVDPRYNFILCSGAVSSAKLYNHAFFPETLEKTIIKVTKDFINNPSYNKISPEKAELNQVFELYREDFVKTTSFTEYINKYSAVKINADAEITYAEFNWSLNSK